MSFLINENDLKDIDEALQDEELPNKLRRKLLALKMRNAGAPLELSLSQTRRIMKRLGMRYRKSGQVPAKANPDEQLEFLNEKLEPRLEEAREGKRKVFFVDAAHFVMGAVVGMLWCFQRVFVRGASGRKRYNVLGAVDSQTKRITTVTNDTYITAPTVCQLLALLRRATSGSPSRSSWTMHDTRGAGLLRLGPTNLRLSYCIFQRIHRT